MSGMQPVPDPYRVLGVARSATITQVKAAHRKLAKRYHPDAPDGDTARFLAIQNAYLLLSDPVRRRRWDASHEPGPVRAGESTPHGRARGAAGRWTREGPDVGAQRSARASTRRGGPAAPGAASRPAAEGDPTDAGGAPRSPDRDAADGAVPGAGTWSASGRDPADRSHTWSAEGVPWWEDFPGARRRSTPPERRGPVPGPAPPPPTPDVYSRSSGAAWSSAARRYFRRSDSELPSRGSFRRQGTQYVTGARAREMADGDEAQASGPPSSTVQERAAAEAVLRPHPGRRAARQALDHEPARATPVQRGAGSMPDAASTARPVATHETLVAHPARRAGTRPRPRSRSTATAADPVRRIAETTLAWIPVAALAAWGIPTTAGCGATGEACPGSLPVGQALVATVALAAFIAFPALARIGALATVGGLAVAVPLLLIVASVGLLPPAPPIVAGAALMVAGGYLAAGALAAAWVWRERRARGSP